MKNAMMMQVSRLLTQSYGSAGGLKLLAVVFPNILKDFRQMLEKAVPGETVWEEYIFEDGGGRVQLQGRSQLKGKTRSCFVEKIWINGQTITGEMEI